MSVLFSSPSFSACSRSLSGVPSQAPAPKPLSFSLPTLFLVSGAVYDIVMLSWLSEVSLDTENGLASIGLGYFNDACDDGGWWCCFAVCLIIGCMRPIYIMAIEARRRVITGIDHAPLSVWHSVIRLHTQQLRGPVKVIA